MQEKERILSILYSAQNAIKTQDVLKLKELSNRAVHSTSVEQNPDDIALAVIVYSISKIIERPSYRSQKGWKKFYTSIRAGIENSIDALEKNDFVHFREHLERMRKKIEGLSGNLKRYIQDVFAKASINKASKIYEHGISMEKTAKLLGISMWDLANYAGQKGFGKDDFGKTVNVKERLKIAQRMFG